MHPRKRLEMANKVKNIQKEKKEEVEITMGVNNQNKFKHVDKILKDIKKKLKFQKIIFIIAKQKKHLKD